MTNPKSKRKRPHQHHFRDLGIYVFESRHSEDFTMEIGEWDFHKLCMIVKGNGLVETKNLTLPICANQLLYLPPYTPHRFQDARGDPMTLVMVCFYDQVFKENPVSLDVLSLVRRTFPPVLPISLVDNYSRLKIKNSFKEMLIEQVQKREGSRAALWCQLVELLIFLTRIQKEQEKMSGTDPCAMAFAGSFDFINKNFYRPIKIDELATLANLSYRRYTEQFKRSTGQTVTQYLSQIRVEYAKRLMMETEDILFAAFEAGFCDLAHFYRVFKKAAGCTPKQFIAGQKIQLQKAESVLG
jgi:AraC-like DNA-binding protein/mannose-6-phosphate isomerase-like protein (cupin superfamily)